MSRLITITSLAHSFQVAFDFATAFLNQAFCSAPSIVRPGVSASGQGASSSSAHGCWSRYWRWSVRKSSARPPSFSEP